MSTVSCRLITDQGLRRLQAVAMLCLEAPVADGEASADSTVPASELDELETWMPKRSAAPGSGSCCNMNICWLPGSDTCPADIQYGLVGSIALHTTDADSCHSSWKTAGWQATARPWTNDKSSGNLCALKGFQRRTPRLLYSLGLASTETSQLQEESKVAPALPCP